MIATTLGEDSCLLTAAATVILFPMGGVDPSRSWMADFLSGTIASTAPWLIPMEMGTPRSSLAVVFVGGGGVHGVSSSMARLVVSASPMTQSLAI